MAKAPKKGVSSCDRGEMDDMSAPDDSSEVEIEVSVPTKKAKGGVVKKAKGGMVKAVKNYSRISRPQRFSGIF